MKIDAKSEAVAHLQDYARKKTIDGVKVINLRRFNDDGGSFTELLRLNHGVFQSEIELPIVQVNISSMELGAIKAFHFHRKQTDVWYVPPEDKVLLILVDLRVESATKDVMQRLILGDCQSQLVIIPPGVAHGCKNIADHKSHIIYCMDQNFSPDPATCDEWRLPWDYFGAEIWDIQRG